MLFPAFDAANCFGDFLPLLSSSAAEIHVQSDLNLEIDLCNLRLSISKFLDWTGRVFWVIVLMQYEAPKESGGIFLNIAGQDGFVPFQINSATVIIH